VGFTRRNIVEPRLRRLELGDKSQKNRLLRIASGKVHTDRQSFGRPMKRHRDGRRAGGVVQRRDRLILAHTLGKNLHIAVHVEIAELRWRRREGGRKDDVVTCQKHCELADTGRGRPQ
jgi:hypothetical protein